jgi:FkbM family methyltransferase
MITDEDVRNAYRGILGREAESAAVVAGHRDSFATVPDLLQAFLQSGEYRRNYRLRSESDALFDGINPGDTDLLARHLSVSEPEIGFVKNFVGTRTRVSHVSVFAPFNGVCFNELPTEAGDYHAEPIEYVGTLRAIEAGSGPFVAVELGAGWGSWVATSGHVARRMGRSPIRLYAVEGNDRKIASIRTHLADNGFDPDEHVQISAVIGARDGYALFEIMPADEGWGSSAIFTESTEEVPGYERVRSISLETLLKDEALVDLIHFDVQGAEAEVVEASIDMLNAKVRYLVIGTHSRAIEGKLIDTLRPRGWLLENEQPSRARRDSNGGEWLVADGTQVWRNPAIPKTGGL